ncbi:TIGR02206 family membrane protein [uncultured Nocardioides sp.]|uniref:YwaF family protein n=1 Tax=uncultured Nocardioides sp. TaxID=198441 RepID=UPI00262F66C3|nr:TIGR02206 family membrane protein [uncultured Nocardioides sp.]
MSSAREFTAYDVTHLTALAVLLVGCAVLVPLGRRLRRTDPSDRTGRVFAVVLLAGTLPLQVLYFTPAFFELDRTLPIQLCDLASFVSVWALWSHRRRAVALTYLWGIPLTTQAILTPDLVTAFPHPVFLLFWVMHIGIVWAAVYLSLGRGLGPSWRDYRMAVAVTAAWAVSVYGLNVALGTNYGFLNAKPAGGSVLDLLGPWPTYVVAEIVIICAVWALMTWPFARRSGDVSRGRPPRRTDPAAPSPPSAGRTAP